MRHQNDDGVTSFVLRKGKPLGLDRLEDFQGASVQVYGTRPMRLEEEAPCGPAQKPAPGMLFVALHRTVAMTSRPAAAASGACDKQSAQRVVQGHPGAHPHLTHAPTAVPLARALARGCGLDEYPLRRRKGVGRRRATRADQAAIEPAKANTELGALVRRGLTTGAAEMPRRTGGDSIFTPLSIWS